jgi:nucleoid-associated protein YgaU
VASGDDAATAGGSSTRAEEKMDTVLHKVERGENFWSISRLYYPSWRYYRALWKYNSDEVKAIDKLYVGTIIKVPPPEDLDPAYIDPPGTRAPRPGGANLAQQSEGAVKSSRDDSTSTSTSTASFKPGGSEGVPIRRARRSDAELHLPVSDPSTEQASDRSFRTGARDRDADADEPEVRPRDVATRPIYKVRPYDTLRTIARDTLGNARRADEILDLNRDLIDDPSHLIVGQILELPEDARAIRPRSRR